VETTSGAALLSFGGGPDAVQIPVRHLELEFEVNPAWRSVRVNFTPETFRRVSEGLCGTCLGPLEPEPMLDASGKENVWRGAICRKCDLWWTAGSASNLRDTVYVEACTASAWEADRPCGLDGGTFTLDQVRTFRG
jgi:hypothetical protein